MMETIPVEIVEYILNYLDFYELINVSGVNKFLHFHTYNTTTALSIRSDPKIDFSDSLLRYSVVKKMMMSLEKFVELKSLKINDVRILSDDLFLIILFRIIGKFRNLVDLTINLHYKSTPKNYLFLSELFDAVFLPKLRKLYIPYIQFDAPTGNSTEFKTIFIERFCKRLKNVVKLNLNFKDNTLMFYNLLTNINLKNLKKLFVISDIYCNLCALNRNNIKLSLNNLDELFLMDRLPNYESNSCKFLTSISLDNLNTLTFDLNPIHPFNNLRSKKIELASNILSSINSIKFLKKVVFLNYCNVFKFKRDKLINNEIISDIPLNYSITDIIFNESIIINQIDYEQYNLNSINTQFTDIAELMFAYSMSLPNLKSLSAIFSRIYYKKGNFGMFKSVCKKYKNSLKFESLIIYNPDVFEYLYILLRIAWINPHIRKLVIIYTSDFKIRRKLLDKKNIRKFIDLINLLKNKLDLLYIHNSFGNLSAKYKHSSSDISQLKTAVNNINQDPRCKKIKNYLENGKINMKEVINYIL